MKKSRPSIWERLLTSEERLKMKRNHSKTTLDYMYEKGKADARVCDICGKKQLEEDWLYCDECGLDKCEQFAEDELKKQKEKFIKRLIQSKKNMAKPKAICWEIECDDMIKELEKMK